MPRQESGLAVEVGGGPGGVDSNDRPGGVGVPLWAALAVRLSCRVGALVSACLAPCLVQWAPLGGWGGRCPLGGVGDPGEKKVGGRGSRE